MSRAGGWLRRKLWEPVRAQLRQGLSARGLAWSLCLAVACSVCPVIGTTTLLCVGAGFLFRLNHPVMQAVNYAAYPLQILLLLSFWRMGERLFGAPRMDLNLAHILAFLKSDTLGAIRFYGAEVWHGAVAWLLLAPPLACVAALILTPVFRRISAAGSSSRGRPRR